MKRVLRPGGKLAVLEFSKPSVFPIKQVFTFYSKYILPLWGKIFSGSQEAYVYLPESVKHFPEGQHFIDILSKCGYQNTSFSRLTFGITQFMKEQNRNMVAKWLMLALLLVIGPLVKGQEINPTYDLHRIHFGFSIIGNYGKLKYNTASDFMDNDTIQTINTNSFPGFGVGGIMNLKVAEYWDFRTMVNIQFVERHLQYNFRGGDIQTAKVNSTYMEIPLQMKYKSKRNHNKRFYWVGGATYRYDFASDIDTERSNTKPIVALYPATFSYDFGAGLDLYYEFFKFSPEIRISNGIGNSMVPDSFIYSSSLSRMSPKLIQFFLHFEG